MAAIGLVFLVLGGLAVVITALANSGTDHMITDFSIVGYDVTQSSGRLFLYGAIAGATTMLGLNMLLAGLGRGFKNKVQNRRQLKAEHKRTEHLEQELQAERSHTTAGAPTSDSTIDLDKDPTYPSSRTR